MCVCVKSMELGFSVIMRLRNNHKVDIWPVQAELSRVGAIYVDTDIRNIFLEYLWNLVDNFIFDRVDFRQNFADIFAKQNYFIR